MPKGSALWLQQIPKVVRRVGVRAPPGRSLIQVDISHAFLQFLARWSGDPELLADLASKNYHEAVASRLGVLRPAAKTVNNAIVGLAEGSTISRHLAANGVQMSTAAAQALVNDWWRRYHHAAMLNQTADHWIRTAGLQGQPVQVVAPDGRRFSFSKKEVPGLELPNGHRKGGVRGIISSFWRAIEGAVMDLAIADLARYRDSHDLRFVLGMFDGLVYSAPEGVAEAYAPGLQRAVENAMARAALAGKATTTVHPYWWSKDPKEQAPS